MSTLAASQRARGLGIGPGYKNWLFDEQALFHTWRVGLVPEASGSSPAS